MWNNKRNYGNWKTNSIQAEKMIKTYDTDRK